MDQNRIPSSSPMQHHNESCGRPTSSSSSDPNAPRPSSSHQNPSGQAGWKQDHTGESSGGIPWVANASGGHWDDDQVGSGQGAASSSRLPPSTQFYPTPVSLAVDSAAPSPQEYIEAPGSALLTSEPLDRSSSTMPSPNLSGPSTVPTPLAIMSSRKSTGKRRARASSLPTADPIFKRRRFTADVPTPSEEWARTFATRRKDPTKLSVQQARARDLGARLLNGRHLRGGCPPGLQILVASHQPLINLRTLKSLDAHEILKQPQLRHDLLFDTLAFRPMNATANTYSDTLTAGADPNYAAATSADHRGVCVSTDMYWESIAVEISTGCRCTRWQVPVGLQLGSQSIKGKERMFECICGAWKKDMTEDEWWGFQKSRMWPSRLPPLIKTLREILISLMGSTTPCPNHFAHSFSREALDLHELTCPTVTHALVPQLYEALDPEFLTRRVRRGAFDLSIFEMLGEAMKVHCAPIRDGLVDEMVSIATSGSLGQASVALGLRRCFDCVEIMKLDIANHQVHALRPYLWSCATNYELSTFNTFLDATSTPLLTSSTRQWVRSASLRVLGRTTPKKRLHLLGQCPCRLGDNTELVIKSAADGFVELIFGDQRQESKVDKIDTGVILEGIWMPSFNAPRWRIEALPEHVPESLRMDIRRIGAFHTEAIELTVLHLLTLVTRNLLSSTHPDLSPKVINTHLKQITHALGPLLISHPIFPSSHPLPSTHPDPELALHLASRILRLEAADQFPYTPEEHHQLDHLTRTISGFIKGHICTEGQLFQKCWGRMGEVVRMMLEHQMMKSENVGVGGECVGQAGRVSELVPQEEAEEEEEDHRSSVPETPEPQYTELPDPETFAAATSTSNFNAAGIRSTTTSAEQRERRLRQHEQAKVLIKLYGLESIYGELRAFVKRMERIAGFNVSVFKGVYGESGMVVGA